MKVFIAGATGVLGRRLVERFAARDDDVVGLTRDEHGDRVVTERGGDPVRGDLFDPDSMTECAAGADVVVHAATAIPTATRPSEEAWERNDRVRREGARALTTAAARVGVEQFLQQSVVWVARREDGEPFDESSDPNPDRSTQSALDAEHLARDAGAEHGFDVAVLRGGWFYAPDTAHTRDIGEQLAAGRFPIVGRGLLGRRDARLSFVHVDDCAAAYVAATDAVLDGTYHVVDDEPATLAAFLRAFAERLDAPEPRRVPAWLAGLLVGENVLRLLTHPMPTTNERLVAATDWTPTYSTHRDGLDAVVESWREEGFLVAGDA